MQRVTFTDNSVNVFGWPSQGGVIVLAEATHVDFQFLGLSTTSPPLTQPESNVSSKDTSEDTTWSIINPNQTVETEGEPTIPAEEGSYGQEEEGDEDDEREDVFCRRLLLLGATWFDSYKRYRFINGYATGLQPYIEDVEEGRKEHPTMRERRWVRVGWETYNDGGETVDALSTQTADFFDDGGFWILDCDTNWMGIIEPENMVPVDAGRLLLAKTMEERCVILRGMGAKHYPNLAAYESKTTFLRAFEWKTEGEVGALKQDDYPYHSGIGLCVRR